MSYIPLNRKGRRLLEKQNKQKLFNRITEEENKEYTNIVKNNIIETKWDSKKKKHVLVNRRDNDSHNR